MEQNPAAAQEKVLESWNWLQRKCQPRPVWLSGCLSVCSWLLPGAGWALLGLESVLGCSEGWQGQQMSISSHPDECSQAAQPS